MGLLRSLDWAFTRAVCPDTRKGAHRLGGVMGLLIAAAFHSCWDEYQDAKTRHDQRIAAYEEAIQDREQVLRELAYHQVTVEGRTRLDLSEGEVRRFISDMRPDFPMGAGKPLLVLALAGVLVLRSVYHPKERKPTEPWYPASK